MLRCAGQRIACITYTEVAVEEITTDVGSSPLFHISTIHSFLWSVVRPFHSDIAVWVAARINEKIANRREQQGKPGSRAATRTRLEEEIAELQAELEAVPRVDKFVYGTGSRYAEGILGHDDILRLAPTCADAHPLLRQLIANSFPYIFVDESQDTNPQVVAMLRRIAEENPGFCVGFFGDPVQMIYTSGAGPVLLGEGWRPITKSENFRCPTSVLEVINAVRLPADGLVQVRGRTTTIAGIDQPVTGSANLFILPADENRSARLIAIRQWLAHATQDQLWLSDLREGDVRLLVLVHRMAATRLGFPALYASLNDKAPASLSEGLVDGTAWPLRPFMQSLVPIVLAARSNDRFSVMSILRTECPRLEPDRTRGQDMAAILAALQEAIVQLEAVLAPDSNATVREVLMQVRNDELLRLDDRFGPHLADEPVSDGRADFDNVQAFLACSVQELWSYRRYYTEESPFATHHGVKGAQFERVLVVVDDEEAKFYQFSYGKYFGYVDPSDSDEAKMAAGEDSVIDRTRRLFYVCCSRAMKDLAVVLFVPDVELARAAIVGKNLFPEANIRGEADLVAA
jgi:DNA helicase-2/ATP-dependent DNA helicase PcrA